MNWKDEETQEKKKGSLSSKVLLGMIVCILMIIILIVILLLTTNQKSFNIYVDGLNVSTNVDKNTIVAEVDNVTYVNIEEVAKLVGYEYHKGEYKSYIIEEDKCYVEGPKETASFYLNDNAVYKLLVNERNKQYEKYVIKDDVKKINNKMYASTEAISRAFNVLVDYKNGQFQIYTLDYLVTLYDTNVKQWGYTGIKDQSFENSKALLQGYLIVKKEGGLYKVIDSNNTKEIVLDRYTAIEFSENMQEFLVTDSSNKVGIVNLDGTRKIDPIYDSIELLDKEVNLYIVEQDKKYGVIAGNGRSVIYPEYDSIGLNYINMAANNKYLVLNELIPVCKDKKWGAFNKNGNLIFNIEYDQFGYTSNSIEIAGVKEIVQPVLTIERANGLVVKKGNKYGLLSVTGKELVRIAVDGIYSINGIQDDEAKYFMLYNGEEINVIQRLKEVGLIEETNNKEEIKDDSQSDIVTDNSIITNNISNTIENENITNTEV